MRLDGQVTSVFAAARKSPLAHPPGVVLNVKAHKFLSHDVVGVCTFKKLLFPLFLTISFAAGVLLWGFNFSELCVG